MPFADYSDSLDGSESRNIDSSTNSSSLRSSSTPESPRPRLSRSNKDSQKSLYELKSASRKKSTNESHLTVNKLRFWRLGLYGRDYEKKILKEIFQRIKTPKDDGPDAKRHLLLISGDSGVGKSTLVRELQAPVEQTGGFFLTGKFDLNQPDEPYSAIVSAVRALCMIILDMPRQQEETSSGKSTSTSSSFQEVQNKLREELGSDVQILVKLAGPMLREIVGQDNAVNPAQVGLGEVMNQFDFAFQRFIRVMSSFGPVVLVMDDIQWSDVSSMHLLEVLLSDTKINNLMVVGLYRSNEVDETRDHLVTKWIKDIEARSQMDGISVQKLELGNLTQPHVNHMLADLLSTDTAQTESLSKIVHKKTLGNVFFVIQFLRSVADEDLLQFNFGLDKWLWKEQEIISSTMATDNVVDLMKVKINRLPSAFLQILPLAACLGAEFSEKNLALLAGKLGNIDEYLADINGVVSERNPPMAVGDEKGTEDGDGEVAAEVESYETSALLYMCVDEGLVEKLAPQSYQWLHDKIQEVALSLVTTAKLSALKFRVGEILCEHLDAHLVDETIFVIVNLLGEYEHLAEPMPLSETMRLRIADLYLRAGRKANQSASFSQGAVYLQKGINLLPARHWESHYDMSLELFSLVAEAEFASGDVGSMEKHCNEVIAQTDRPIEDKFRAYNVLIDSIGGRKLLDDAIKMILSVLSQLGCNLPKRGRDLHILAGVIRAKATVKKITPDKISKLQKMTDPMKIQAMRLLDKLATFAFYAESNLLPLSILKRWRWTSKYGISEFSPPTFVVIGLILCDNLGDIQGGNVYASHALSLLDKFDCRAVESRTLLTAYCLVLHWSTPVHDCMKPMLRAYETGMATGDLESAFWGIYQHIEFALASGRSLHSIEADLSVFSKQMKDFSLVYHQQHFVLLWQGILHLQGHSNDPTELAGEVVSSDFIQDAEDRTDRILAMIHRVQILLAYWYGDEDRGPELAVQYGDERATATPGSPGGLYSRVYAAVICLDAGRRPGGQKYVKYGRKLARKVKSWVEGGNPNVLQFDALLDAELAVLAKRPHVAAKHYEAAALLAARRGFLHDQAKINERFAEFALTIMKDEHEAEYRIKESVKLYEEWGAHGKVNQLQKKYPQFFKVHLPPVEVMIQKGADRAWIDGFGWWYP